MLLCLLVRRIIIGVLFCWCIVSFNFRFFFRLDISGVGLFFGRFVSLCLVMIREWVGVRIVLVFVL